RIAPAPCSTWSATALRCTSTSRVCSPPSVHWATAQSMASSGPATKPSTDMVTCQITLLKALRPLDQLNEDTARRLEVLRVDIGYESPRNRAHPFPDPRQDCRAVLGQLGGPRAAQGGARDESLAFEFLQQLGDLGPVHSELARAGEELVELAGVL